MEVVDVERVRWLLRVVELLRLLCWWRGVFVEQEEWDVGVRCEGDFVWRVGDLVGFR